MRDLVIRGEAGELKRAAWATEQKRLGQILSRSMRRQLAGM